MAQVNSHGERWQSERRSTPTPASRGEQPAPRVAEFLGLSVPISGRRDCPHRSCWRRERNCRQTLSAAFSMGYEPHKLRWVLPRESMGCWLLGPAMRADLMIDMSGAVGSWWTTRSMSVSNTTCLIWFVATNRRCARIRSMHRCALPPTRCPNLILR